MKYTGEHKMSKQEPKILKEHVYRVEYRIDVRGALWQGNEGKYSYSLPYNPTPEEIKRAAGDFRSITAYTITCIESKYRETRKYVEYIRRETPIAEVRQ